MQKGRKKILDVQLYKGAQPNRLLQQQLENKNYSYEVYNLGTESTLAILLKSFLIPKRLSNYDVILTSEYFTSFGINLRLLLTTSKPKHITIGLNQSRRLLKTKFRSINRILDFVFRRTNLVIVHSRQEAVIFERIHNIPANKFYFSLWGYDLPESSATRFSRWPKPYVCLIGRNNRDVATFIKALDGMNIDGIIVTSRDEAPLEKIPANVHVFIDLPTNETLDCIKNAVANAILLKDNDRGAGHITAVAAMFSGTPQIVSNADVLKDYFINGVSAITVALGDAQGVRAAIERLMSDPAYSERLTANARNYAERWLTNERVINRITYALNKLVEGQELATVDKEWLGAYESLKGASNNDVFAA